MAQAAVTAQDVEPAPAGHSSPRQSAPAQPHARPAFRAGPEKSID